MSTGLMASLIAVLPATKPAFASDQLTFVSYGGAYQKAQRQAFIEPFTKQSGVKVNEDEYNGDLAKIRAMVQTKAVSWDVISSTVSTARLLCDEGVIERIDWKKLGLDRAKFTDADKYECAFPESVYSVILAYDKDKLPSGPKTIGDLFDTKKFPGKRGLIKSPTWNLEWALIADGVPVKDVYKVLSTPEGVDRAFKKLDTIKENVIWWTSNAQPPQLLADGQVVMTSAANGRIYDANKNSGKNFEIIWDGQALSLNIWMIPKGAPNLDAIYKFLHFAGSPQGQTNLARYISYGPANADAMAEIEPATRAVLPNTADHMTNAFVTDPVFWANHREELLERFTAWLAK
ncbi:ABC transporter substrate-binding protein [Bradyrhizobium sp. 164]|uniref:ABC transporter substrate-binding protein n=1 Tax=Bradyrhizobium sp. 164 TaxID=2782637 RepID=UPI001FFBD44A